MEKDEDERTIEQETIPRGAGFETFSSPEMQLKEPVFSS
jgi:hypothetical protein